MKYKFILPFTSEEYSDVEDISIHEIDELLELFICMTTDEQRIGINIWDSLITDKLMHIIEHKIKLK